MNIKDIRQGEKRDLAIDYIRAISIIMIILAHINPPNALFQIRSFDVVSLVVISVICMHPVYDFKSYLLSIKKRVKRLLVPTYICITVVLLISFLICKIIGIPYIYNVSSIISSYLLIDGIGYIWVVRIFLILTILYPVISKISHLNSFVLFCLCSGILLASRFICLNMPENKFAYYLVYYYYLYSIGYVIISLIGLKIKDYNKTELIYFICIGLAILVAYKLFAHIYFNESLIEFVKHPPMLDWILYGLIITGTLFLVFKSVHFFNNEYAWYNRTVVWISKNSFRIYFSHIYIIKLISLIELIQKTNYFENWFIKYILILTVSILLTYFFDKIIDPKFKYIKQICFNKKRD